MFDYPNHPFNLSLDIPTSQTNLDDLALQRRTLECSILYARVAYCANRLSLLPHVFASTGQTMYIHRQSFEALQPPALQKAMSACALYSMQTPLTKPLVHQVLQHDAHHLLSTTDPSTCSNHDLLAALQALLLYQLIRLFDGDIRLRATAESDEATAILWASELRTRACAVSLPLQPVATLADEAEDWQLWLFHESIRRTVVTTFLLRGVYNYLKTGTDVPTGVGVYFTAQERLWNAQSEMGWARAKVQCLELQVFVNAWDELIALANPDDLEELGVLVMSMLWGLPATQNWLGYELCVRYGLEGQPALQNMISLS
ncbi:hypothetical protein E8E12_002626 [Didymella heteroderae]|uniref:Uncharacterized protein n=1 Tax=Didymella heteroderae TaxID=1769908 RepID=A0A9P4WHS9_9PLEO|nr:hypothetical protein E8E12_002626 [Didymella heteroderae]